MVKKRFGSSGTGSDDEGEDEYSSLEKIYGCIWPLA